MNLRHLLVSLAPALSCAASAAVFNVVSNQDVFVTSGSGASGAGDPSKNYGAAGALMISAAGSTKGTMDTLLKFNLAAAKTSFDTQFGAGHWMINSIKLQLGTNFGDSGEQPNNQIFNAIHGGAFGIDWIANDGWVEGSGTPGAPFTPANAPFDGPTYNSLNLLLGASDKTIGVFNYVAAGDTSGSVPPAVYTFTLDPSFVADVTAGGDVSMLAYPSDSQVNYLFNSYTFGTALNRPTLVVDAVAVPEPGTFTFSSIVGLFWICRRHRRANAA